MNRETKRILQRQAQVEDDGSLAELDHEPVTTPLRRRPRRRATPFDFLREIRDELRQVAWPTRVEMINFSTVVFFTLVLMVALIFVLNLAFGKVVFFMFQK